MIVNTHQQLTTAVNQGVIKKEESVYVMCRPYEHRRCITSAWIIGSPLFKTDPQAHWSDYGHATVSYGNREDKKVKFQEAIKIAQKYYNGEFVRNRIGDYVPKIVNDKLPIPKRAE